MGDGWSCFAREGELRRIGCFILDRASSFAESLILHSRMWLPILGAPQERSRTSPSPKAPPTLIPPKFPKTLTNSSPIR